MKRGNKNEKILFPQMLMLNAAWYEIILIVVTSVIGMLGISMCMERFWNSRLNVIQMILSLAGGLLLIYPGWITDLIGIVLVGSVIVWQVLQKNKCRGSSERMIVPARRSG